MLCIPLVKTTVSESQLFANKFKIYDFWLPFGILLVSFSITFWHRVFDNMLDDFLKSFWSKTASLKQSPQAPVSLVLATLVASKITSYEFWGFLRSFLFHFGCIFDSLVSISALFSGSPFPPLSKPYPFDLDSPISLGCGVRAPRIQYH